MSISVSGTEIAATESGFLENVEDWSEEIATVLAAQEQLELSDRHWDLIRLLRDEYINNGGSQPNTRNLVKAMSKTWDDKSISAKTLYELFPGDPSKQGGRIAGLPESR
ncbi:MAG: TusE/DsrC/DsvC family sulfur relay protein, partial [Gammaproteobacteria bacterium]|nr:TusE/DsrC/DsvC family sulfur relay protein [Gammaproteobacteria bacterium]